MVRAGFLKELWGTYLNGVVTEGPQAVHRKAEEGVTARAPLEGSQGAAIMKYHGLDDLKSQKYVLRVQEAKSPKSRCWQG